MTARPQHTVWVNVDLPSPHREKARYAIESLLMPLGVVPRWVESQVRVDGPFVYYGHSGSGRGATLTLPCDPRAAAVLEGVETLDMSSVTSIAWQGELWPVLFRDLQGSPDLVASTYYLLAGVQEVTIAPRDQHGRFNFETSIQRACDFAAKPVVDVYREILASLLSDAGIPLERRSWGAHSWAVCPTFDIDYLWKWRKGMVYREVVRYFLMNDLGRSTADRTRRIGTFLRDLVKPGDVYRRALERMVDEVRFRDGTATVFLKAGAHGSRDVSYSLSGRWLDKVVASARRAGFEIGLHPSYYAHTHGGYLRAEVEKLETELGVRPTSVRQHYLRYDPRVTLDLHRSMGFQIDSTLGFPDREGFRRSTCMPFKLYDAQTGEPADVWEMPLVAMDGTLFNRRHLSPDEAFEVTKDLLDRCRAFGGCAVLLWHNVLWDEMDAPGWGRHFIDVLDYAASNGALIADLNSALRRWRDSVA